MNTPNDGGPAFPVPEIFTEDGDIVPVGSSGLSLRDWFAGMALNGMAANESWSGAFATPEDTEYPENYLPEVARVAYAAADAMLKAREKFGTRIELKR